jgi:hypothetical protein
MKYRTLTPKQARRQAIEIAKDNPGLDEMLRLEKANPDLETRLMWCQLAQLVRKAVRLGKDQIEFHYWVDGWYEQAHMPVDDLEKWERETGTAGS